MHIANLENKIEPKNELQAMIGLIILRWENYQEKEIINMLSFIWEECLKITQNYVDNKYEIINALRDWATEREQDPRWQENISPKEISLISYNDDLICRFRNISIDFGKVDEYIMSQWDYSKTCSKITNKVRELYLFAKDMKPKGWDKLKENYNDFDGMSEYCDGQDEFDEKFFKGTENKTANSSTPFPSRVALPYVMYDDICQGRKPLYTLVGAMLAQAMLVNGHNNIVDMLEEIKKLKTIFNKDEYFQEIQHDVQLMDKVQNKFLKAAFCLYENIHTYDSFKNNLKQLIKSNEKYEQLSDEEKQKIKQDNSKQIAALLAQLKSTGSIEKSEDEMIKDKQQEEKIEFYLNENKVKNIKNKLN